MKARPNRDDYPCGTYGEWDYQEDLERYIDYLLRYYIKPKQRR